MSDLKQKPFDIPKRLVWEAYRKVAANKGAAGVDGQSIAEFEEDLKGNLYKLWNRLSSGAYFPPPVRGVEIPKKAGGTRMLGVPTVADRIAQTVVCMVLEPTAEPVFHPDSYGYRPGRSALHAVAKARRRCWENDWVIDMDIRAFFDTVPWDLGLRAVKHHSREPWVLLYVKRWLQAPLQLPDGTISERTMGTPQGSAISPLLADLFMHYAFDAWMARTYPNTLNLRIVRDGHRQHDQSQGTAGLSAPCRVGRSGRVAVAALGLAGVAPAVAVGVGDRGDDLQEREGDVVRGKRSPGSRPGRVPHPGR